MTESDQLDHVAAVRAVSSVASGGTIPPTAIHFTTHSNLTLNASKLMEIIQMLVNGHNAHESLILDMQAQMRQVKMSDGGSQPPAARASPHRGLSETPDESSSPPAVLFGAAATSPPPRAPSPATAAAKKAAGRRAPTADAADGDALRENVLQLQQVLGLQTDTGRRAFQQFSRAVCATTSSQKQTEAPYEHLLRLPLMSALQRAVGKEEVSVDGPCSSGTTDTVMTQLRGIEGQVAVLSSIVETLQQQVSSVAGAAVGSSRKANTAQRSPLASSFASGSASGQSAVDAAARVDVARLSKELHALQLRVQAVAAKQQATAVAAVHSTTSDDDDDTSSQNEDVQAKHRMAASTRQPQAAALSALTKRVDGLEKAVLPPKMKGGPADASPTNKAKEPTTTAGNSGGTVVKADIAVAEPCAPPHSNAPPPWEAAVRAVEETALIGIRKAKDAITGSFGSQVDGLRTDVNRVMEWIDGHELLHEQLHQAHEVAVKGSRAGSLVLRHGTAGDCEASAGDGLTPRRPASAALFSTTSASPYVPKRDAVVRAAAASARFSKSQTLTGGRPVDNQRPQQVSGDAAGKSTGMLFRLFHGPQSAGGSVTDARGAGISTGASPSVALSASNGGSSHRGDGSPNTTTGRPHDPATCVVWKCGWCASSRDQVPSWCASPTPPHR